MFPADEEPRGHRVLDRLCCLWTRRPRRRHRRRGGGGVDASDNGSGSGSGSGDVSVTYVYAHTSSALYRVDPTRSRSRRSRTSRVFRHRLDDRHRDRQDRRDDRRLVRGGLPDRRHHRVATRMSTGLSARSTACRSSPPRCSAAPRRYPRRHAQRGWPGVPHRSDDGQSTSSATWRFASSGDLVAVKNFGTVQTADNGFSADRLVRLAPQTFAATAVGSDIGYGEIWGVAYWKDKIFGSPAAASS